MNWKEEAIRRNCSHLLIVFDMEDKDIYPYYVKKSDDLKHICKYLELSEKKQKIKEIINIK